MLGLLAGVLTIAHGLITIAIWTVPAGKDAPFDASHSWLLGDVRTVSVVLGTVVGVSFVATGVGILADFAWWPLVAVVAGAGGAVLMVVWFNVWLILGLTISVAVLVAGIQGLVSS